MLFFSRWKVIFILGAVILGFLFALPNAIPAETRAKMPAPLQRTLNLGLDLQGGAHLLLEVDVSSVLAKALQSERDAIADGLRNAGRIRAEFIRVEGNSVVGRLRDAADMPATLGVLRDLSVLIDPAALSQDRTTSFEQVGEKGFRVDITDANIESIKAKTIDQSINVLRRRIDPTGTTEMTLAREGDDRILVQVPGAKNIDEIKDRVNTTANLSFHMVRQDSFNERALQAASEGRLPPGAAFFLREVSLRAALQSKVRVSYRSYLMRVRCQPNLLLSKNAPSDRDLVKTRLMRVKLPPLLALWALAYLCGYPTGFVSERLRIWR